MYCSRADLEIYLTKDILEKLTDTVALTADPIIEAVILDSTDFIDSYLLQRYVLPLDPVPRSVKRACTVISAYYLMPRRVGLENIEESSMIGAQYRATVKWLENVRAGLAFLEKDNSVVIMKGSKSQNTEWRL